MGMIKSHEHDKVTWAWWSHMSMIKSHEHDWHDFIAINGMILACCGIYKFFLWCNQMFCCDVYKHLQEETFWSKQHRIGVILLQQHKRQHWNILAKEVKQNCRFRLGFSSAQTLRGTVDREIFALKIIRPSNFCIKNISSFDGSTT